MVTRADPWGPSSERLVQRNVRRMLVVEDACRPRFSVVIPAHNEATVLARSVLAWLGDLEPGEAEVVVVANGCTDETAAVARGLGVQVVELATASKSTALTAGDAAVTTFPRIYLDADITVAASTLRA